MLAMSVLLDYEQGCEILPGVYRRLRDCSAVELDMATECRRLRSDLRAKAEALLREAAHYGIPVPDDLRDQLALSGGGDVPMLVGLVDDLEAIVRAEALAA